MDGRLAEATDLLERAAETARLLDEDQGLMWTLSMQSSVALLAGDVDRALDTAREAHELTSGAEEGLITAWAALPLARVLVELGEHRRAVELMLKAAGGEQLVRIPAGWRTMWLEVLTRARLELGDTAAARRSAEHAAAWARHVGLPYAAAMADLAAARVQLAAGDPAGAAATALRAAVTAESAGARVDGALARTAAGQALAAAGDRDGAIAVLAQAAADLAGFGAARYREAAEHELRRLGERVRRRARVMPPPGSGMQSLSERELEIARLTVDRMTNREIGRRLFLSEKTIETHMRHIFFKLGVSSRVEVARATERADRRAGLTRSGPGGAL